MKSCLDKEKLYFKKKIRTEQGQIYYSQEINEFIQINSNFNQLKEFFQKEILGLKL